MLPVEVFNRFLLLLPFTQSPNYLGTTPGGGATGGATDGTLGEDGTEQGSWSYDNTENWGARFPECDGYRQSPIHLRTITSIMAPLPGITFGNYNTPLASPLILDNNGHSIELAVPPTVSGYRPYITGGLLKNRFNAVNVHFHWGSPGRRGAEHLINNRRYDVEVHIVHKNEKYSEIEEAVQHNDGLAVLAIMLQIVNFPDRTYPGYNRIFQQLPNLREYRSTSVINGEITLRQLLGDLNTKDFFTYQGSLTTPPCAEAVTFIVFPRALPVSYDQVSRFFDVTDEYGQPMVNNFRPIEPTNKRPVFYRAGTSSIMSLFKPY